MPREMILLPSGFSFPVISLSPMMGVMSGTFLDAVHELDLADFFLTEFVSVTGGSIPSSGVLRRRLSRWIAAAEKAENFVPQILGRDAESLVSCAEKLLRMQIPFPVRAINLNAGCPSPVVVGNGAGSALLKAPSKLGKFVEKLKDSLHPEISLSVKLRAGFENTRLLEDSIKACTEGGAELVIFHVRTAQEMYGPMPGDAEQRLERACTAAGRVPVIGNGSVRGKEDLSRFLACGCAGVSAGRGFLKDPYLLRKLENPEKTFPSAEEGVRLLTERLKALHSPPGPLQEFLHAEVPS